MPDRSTEPPFNSRFRVKVRDPHTVREYVVTAASRDAAWRYVTLHRDELTPDDEHTEGGVYWAVSDE